MTIEEFLADYGSMTGYFAQLSSIYELKVLKQHIVGQNFHRIVAIYLEHKPVVLAHSITALSNRMFVDILGSCQSMPIGTKIFANDSKILRNDMVVEQISLDEICNTSPGEISDFIKSLSLMASQSTIFCRRSNFIYKSEKMLLNEFILPELHTLLAKV